MLALLVAAGALAGCSGEGGDGASLSDEEQSYADALTATYQADDAPVTEDEASCMAEVVVGEIGLSPFEDAALAPEDIEPGEELSDLGVERPSDDQAAAIVDGWDGCIDLPEVIGAAFAGELGLDEAGIDCVADRLREDDLAAEAARTFLAEEEPPGELLAALTAAAGECAGDGDDNPIVASLAEEFAADGTVTPEQAQCLARVVIDEIGLERLVAFGVGEGDFEDAPPEVQQEFAEVIVGGAGDCGIPLSSLGD